MDSAVPFAARIDVPDTVLIRELDGEAVILNLETESYLGLDAVGTRMWAALTTQPSVEAAFGLLLAEYDVAPETLRADLQRLLGELREHGLITILDA